MSFKFEQLDVWNMSLEYSDGIYALAEMLPESERFNLRPQITRAVTSISLNIAEGSTGQSNPEQSRFLGMVIRSLIKTVACQRIIVRRKYVNDTSLRRLHSFRRALTTNNQSVGEEQASYDTDEL